MRIGRVRPHYGSAAIGYPVALALTVLAAVLRENLGPASSDFPFVLFYPVIIAVSFFWGLAPGAAAILFSAFSIPVILPEIHPSMVNWLALAAFGAIAAGLGALLRGLRDAAEEAARAVLRFRLVTDNVSDWIFFLDSAGRVDYANRSGLAGLARKEEEVRGRPFAMLLAPTERSAFEELMRAVLATPAKPREFHLERNGESVPVELGCTAIRANHETVIHVACRDLRERRETERRLREGRQWEALGTLAGGIAHDFNNLLTAMMGNASLAREMLPPTHETAGLLDSVLATGARSANLIELMLAAAGYRRNLVTAIEPRPLLESAVAKVDLPANVHIAVRAGSGVFRGEHASLEKLLVCLLENAVESYEERGGEVKAEVELALYQSSEPGEFEEGECAGECLRIVVEDYGCGMEAETAERAFNPFFTTKFTGRGLGLAAVRGLVRAYSGKLWMRSRPGEGTRFEVWLPNQTNGNSS